MIKKQKTKFPSELRLDLISKDWVVIATGRAKRPEAFKKEKRPEIKIPEKDCPFCNIETQEKPVLILSQGKKIPLKGKIPQNWTTVVIPNKFPAFLPQPRMEKKIEGNFLLLDREEETYIPMHRIKEVKKNNAIVWRR